MIITTTNAPMKVAPDLRQEREMITSNGLNGALGCKGCMGLGETMYPAQEYPEAAPVTNEAEAIAAVQKAGEASGSTPQQIAQSAIQAAALAVNQASSSSKSWWYGGMALTAVVAAFAVYKIVK